MEARKPFVIALVFAFVGTFFLSSIILPEVVSANTLFVGGAGPGNFTSIQNAIFAADPGDTVFVYNGTYYENIEIYKTLTLVGEHRDNTTIDGGGSDDVVHVTGHWVNISGFSLRSSGSDSPPWAGIRLYSSHNCHIFDNNVSSNWRGIFLEGAENCTLESNYLLSNNETGIYMTVSESNLVSDNSIVNSTAGIFMRYSSHNVFSNNTLSSGYYGYRLRLNSNFNTIEYESITNNVYGIHLYNSLDNVISNSSVSAGQFGIYAVNTGGSTISGNVVTSNTQYGILVSSTRYWAALVGNTVSNNTIGIHCSLCDNARITHNEVFGNQEGIYIYRGSGSTVSGNNASSNSMRGIYLHDSDQNSVVRNNVTDNGLGIYVYSSSGNTIAHNNIINNLDQAYEDEATNTWDYGYPAGGNYWSDYTGNDIMMGPDQDIPGSDGLGDLPYDLDVSSIDRYPLLSPSLPPLMLPSQPLNLQATPGNQQVELTWDPPVFDGRSTIQNYSIYRGNTSGGESFLVLIGSALSHIDSGLTNGKTYYYEVSAVNDVGEGPMSNEANATPATVPSAPQSLQASAGIGHINLSWSPPLWDGGSPVTNHSIYRRTPTSGEQLLVVLGNVTNFTDSGVSNGQTYLYRVSATNAMGEGAKSNQASATVPMRPTPPINLAASPGDQQVNLSWSPPVNDGNSPITNYTVYRGTSSGGETPLVKLSNVLFHLDTGLARNQTYYYQVTATNAVDESMRSSETSTTTPTFPSEPRALGAVPGNKLVTLSWSPPAFDGNSPITNYSIYRGTTSGGEAFLVEIGNMLIYTDAGLFSNETYYYQVSATNEVGEGPRSGEANATPFSIPSEPINLQADPGDGVVQLSWSPPTSDGNANITNYVVYRGPFSGGEFFLAEIGNVSQFADSNVTNGQMYFYEVTARNFIGEGPRSNEANATPLAPPRPPSNVSVDLSGPTLHDVTATWSLSPDDGGGLGTVIAYAVYRGTVHDPGGLGYQSLGAVLNGTSVFVDSLSGDGDPNSYFYRVCAVDVHSVMACAAEQGGKYTRPLIPGPNLISVPLIQSNESMEHVLRTVRFDKAWAYDPVSADWRTYMKSKPYLVMWSINNSMGMWVNVTENCSLTITGLPPAQTAVHLHAGWNLVGSPSLSTSFTVADLRATVPVERVEAFDATAPPNFLRVLQDSDVLLAGHAYWVKVNQDTVWVISN